MANPFCGTYKFQRTICFAGQVPTNMEECAGRVVLGMMVCAFRVYAPLCISDWTLNISASAIASGRNPSKLTINTREIAGVKEKVNVGEGVSVAGGGVPLGTRVTTRGGATVGGVGEANDPHDCKKTITRVKSQLRKTGFRVFLQKRIYPGQWSFH